MLDTGKAVLCRAEWLPAPLCCTTGALPTRLSSYRKEGSDLARLQCLVRVNRGLSRNQLPLSWIHPSAAWGCGALSYYSFGKYSADTRGSGFPMHRGQHSANSDTDSNLHWGKTGILCSPHTACPISCPIEKHTTKQES